MVTAARRSRPSPHRRQLPINHPPQL